ncbi:MAG: Ig-like domain-containing protein [Chloroflexota bacterium]
MRASNRLLSVTLLILIAVVMTAGCRRAEQTTDATPVASTAEAIPTEATATEEVAPTTEAEAQPTAVPVGVQPIAPEDIDWPPQVIESSPTSGEQAALDAVVLVRFDQPMDQASVEQAFVIEPAVDGDFEWPAPDTMSFTPANGLSRSTGYSMRVADSASAVNGLTLEQPVEIDWQTVGNFEVTQVTPEDGSRGVQTDAVVTVVFSQPIVPLVATGDQADLPQPLIFDPPVEGHGEWISTSIYRFQADPALAGVQPTPYRWILPGELLRRHH